MDGVKIYHYNNKQEDKKTNKKTNKKTTTVIYKMTNTMTIKMCCGTQ